MSVPSTVAAELSSPDDLRRRLDSLTRLLDVTRVLAGEIDLDKILRTITREACKALHCDRASLYQYDPKTNELYTRVVTKLELEEIRKQLGQGISGASAEHRVIINVPDPPSDPRWDSSVDDATGYTTRSILAAPLAAPHDGSLLGVLELINKKDGAFDRADEELVEAFGQHAAVALDRARLVDELRRQQSVQASLDVAREIQRGFMPDVLPEIAGYEVDTWWFPNEAIGGDYCDVVPLSDGRVLLVIADVSGHGIGPSLIMASARAALRALLIHHSSSDVLLSMLSRSLAADLQEGRFITAVLCGLDAHSHTVEFSNAGHAPAFHYSPASGQFANLEATGMPLGIDERSEYPPGPPFQMNDGDLLLLCTDGIVEAMNDAGEQFGQRRLQQIVSSMATAPLTDLVHTIGAEVTSHYIGDSPPDDLTVLALRRRSDRH